MNARKKLDATQRHALLATPWGWLACGFGSGLAPVAQGTFGSLAALLPWLGLRLLPAWAYLLALGIGFAIGVRACTVAGGALRVDDHRALVWDEFIGQWLALFPLLLPALVPATGFRWWMPVAGFALFRLFDVWKPWPIGWLDRRVKGGLGVMIDDVVAGAIAAVALSVVVFFW